MMKEIKDDKVKFRKSVHWCNIDDTETAGFRREDETLGLIMN